MTISPQSRNDEKSEKYQEEKANVFATLKALQYVNE